MNVPFIFKPFYLNDKCLIDGGLLNNNPIKNCIEKSILLLCIYFLFPFAKEYTNKLWCFISLIGFYIGFHKLK